MHAKRRPAAMVACLAGTIGLGCGSPDPAGDRGVDVWERPIPELAAALASGETSAVELVAQYRARIEAFDRRGPALNAVVMLNPAAREEAVALDLERAAGVVRGALHGIPVLVKDNYDTVDMPTSAGAIGLAGSRPPDDAFQVRALRDAGAIILGKTNMHELAYGLTTISSLGGQTRNPYDPSRNPGGSSGGTGAAVAASFAAVGLGSDTCGSIRIPSSHQALVGLRGTRGLSSRDGIVPLSSTQDMGGPLGRSVEDVAIVLDATVGFDPADPVTRLGNRRRPATYTASLDPTALAGARLGVLAELMGDAAGDRPVRIVIDAAIDQMRRGGAAIVDVESLDLSALLPGASVLVHDFRPDLDAYLAQTPGAGVRSLRELVERGLYHRAVAARLHASLAAPDRESDEYRARIAQRDVVRETVVGVMDELELEALVYPTIRRTATRIGEGQPGNNCALSAVSGLPALTVPAGFAADEMPVGLELLGRAFDEPRLIALAYAFEQATGHRRPPDFTPSLVTTPPPVAIRATAVSGGTASSGATLRLVPSTRVLEYVVGVAGVRDSEVIGIDLHGRDEGSERGPVIRRLSGRGRGRAAGRFTLEGAELRLLRAGRLYLDVHTTDRTDGIARVDLALPDAG